MKTAISIPDEIYNNAEKLAKNLGLSRSKLFTIAIKEYIEEHNNDFITDKLNEIYINEDNSVDQDLQKIQFKSIKKEKDKW